MGNADDDILFAAFTDFDTDETALLNIAKEWNSSRDYSTRMHNLDGAGRGPRDDGDVFPKADSTDGGVVNRGTVHGYAIADILTGSAGQDWFIANTDGGGRDRITDLTAPELASDLDFILS